MSQKKTKLQQKEIIVISIIALFAILFAIYMQTRVAQWSKFPVFFETKLGKTPVFHLDIASTTPEVRRGLMYVNDLPKNQGMIFVFDKEKIQTFWMKNTPLPLDMIFIDKDLKVVGVVENAPPFSEDQQRVEEPSKYVIELNGGTSSQYGIKKGAVMKTQFPLPRGIEKEMDYAKE